MENGIKALLLSASVLLAIALIGIGTYLVSMSNDSTDISTLDELAVQTYNKKYELAEGIQSGSVVKQLLNYAIEDNRKLGDSARQRDTEKICINIRSNSEEILNAFRNKHEIYHALTTREHGVRYEENIRQISNIISNTKKYRIWYTYTKTGYIWEIHIDKI